MQYVNVYADPTKPFEAPYRWAAPSAKAAQNLRDNMVPGEVSSCGMFVRVELQFYYVPFKPPVGLHLPMNPGEQLAADILATVQNTRIAGAIDWNEVAANLRALRYEVLPFKYSDLSARLTCGFTFACTDQGHEYWWAVRKLLRSAGL